MQKIEDLKQKDKGALTFFETFRLNINDIKEDIKNSPFARERREAHDCIRRIKEANNSGETNILKRGWQRFRSLWKEEKVRRHFWMRFESIVTLIVILNYFVVMLSTYSEIQSRYDTVFSIIEFFFVSIYAIEIIIRISMENIEGKWWYFFWLSPKKEGGEKQKAKTKLFWNYFDLLITLTAIAAHHPALSSMRIMRCFRLFSLFTVSHNLRMISDAVINSLKSISWAGIMLIVVFSIFAVFGCQIYEYSGFFDNAGQGMVTLFQMMTLDDAGDIMHELSLGNNYTYIFFFIFIIITAFVIMNVITGAIVKSMADAGEKEKERLQQLLVENTHENIESNSDINIRDLELENLQRQLNDIQKTIDIIKNIK